MADEKTKNKNRTVTISRYGWIVSLLFLVVIAILFCIFKIKYKEGSMWRSLGKNQVKRSDTPIRPIRGNIYADDGRILAASEPLYGVYLDFLSEGINRDSLMKDVTPLSYALNNLFPKQSASDFKRIMLDGWNLSRRELALLNQERKLKTGKRIRLYSRHVRLIKQDITYLELQKLYKLPFLNQRSNKSGMFTEEKTTRIKPFGSIAGRTVGSIYKDYDRGGASGLELKFDSVLHGKPGLKARQRIEGRWIDIVKKDPQPGLDIQTTLNVDIQSLTEKALYKRLSDLDAESGCAVIMETATGEIKGIANLDRIDKGVYAEGNPNVFSYMEEPGSTFKTVSLMAALDDGLTTPEDTVYVGNGLFPYGGKVVKDWYWRSGERKKFMTITEGMYLSSNVVISKMILRAYQNNPMKYVQHIHRIGITKKLNWDVPLRGIEGRCIIRYPNDKNNPWSQTTLPWMSFGYETMVPPIYLLMFYNGIANDGKMIKPFITKAFLKDNEVVKEFKPEVVNPSMCSEKTLTEIRKILRGVVTNGTAKAVNSPIVSIAGKTGTAMIADKGKYNGYYISFCGYFPADHPKYTCFVSMRRPHGSPSGGLMSGVVLRQIAEGVTIMNTIKNPVSVARDSIHSRIPGLMDGDGVKTKLVLNELGLKYKDESESGEWIDAKNTKDAIGLVAKPLGKGLVPNVVGMGARDAVYLLENAGLKVVLNGCGKVTKQSLMPGERLIKGSQITIELN